MSSGSNSFTLAAAAVVTVALAAAQITVPDTLLSLPNAFNDVPTEWTTTGSTKFENNKVILADSAGTSGAIWSKHKNPFSEWTAEFLFHASGSESYPPNGQQHAKDGIAFWYAAVPGVDGPIKGSRDYWDGLALFLDYDGWDEEGAGSDRGAIKGHLNDGATGFTSFLHGGLNAFSFCRIGYRNSIDPIKVQVGYGQGSLLVIVNGQKCFESKKVTLPKDEYFFGLSALSAGDKYTIDGFHVFNGIHQDLTQHLTKTVEPAAAAPVDDFVNKHDQPPSRGSSTMARAQSQPREFNVPAGYGGIDMQEMNKLKEEILGSIKALSVSTDPRSGEQQPPIAPQVDLQPILSKLEALEVRINQVENIVRAAVKEQSSDMDTKVDALREHFDALIARVNSHTAKSLTAAFPGGFPDKKDILAGAPGFFFYALLTGGFIVQLLVTLSIGRRKRDQKLL